MGGTILNAITVAIGGTLGLLVGNRLSERIQESVVTGLGLVTFYVGIDNAGHTGNPILPLLSIMIGVIIGELLQIDVALDRFAAWLQTQYAGSSNGKSTQSSSEESEDDTGRYLECEIVHCANRAEITDKIFYADNGICHYSISKKNDCFYIKLIVS